MTVEIRPAAAADIEACGRIIFEAFRDIAERHRFPTDFPTVEHATQLARMFVGHPAIWGVVAESGGRVVGCNFLEQRDAIHSVGPIVIDPGVQARGIGRRFMGAVLDRGRDSGSAGRVLHIRILLMTPGRLAKEALSTANHLPPGGVQER